MWLSSSPFSCCNILPFITSNPAFNFYGERKKDETEIKNGERIFVFSVKRQRKERGREKRKKDGGGLHGGGPKKMKKIYLGQKGKEKKGKGKRMDRESRGLILHLGSFLLLFFFSRSKTLDL